MHAGNAKIHCVNNRSVYGTTGRTPEPITHGKTMVHHGAIRTDATFIACLKLGNFRTTDHARIIIQAISGCRESVAKAKVVSAQYTDPPTNHEALLIPSYAHDHCQTSLIITAAQMINLGATIFDVQSNSASSCAAALLASLVNNWTENVQGCRVTNPFWILDWVAVAPTFPPQHLDEVVKLMGTRITFITCAHDMLSMAGDPAPAMERKIDEHNTTIGTFPMVPKVNSIRFGGSVHELRGVLRRNMHGVSIVYHILCTNELDVHITAEGVSTPGIHNCVYIEKVRQYAPIADQISSAGTFIIDLIQETATNADGDMCVQSMKAHITDATKL